MGNINAIEIPIKAHGDFIEYDFQIKIPYSSSITIQNLLNKITIIIKKNKYPKIYYIHYIDNESFVGMRVWEGSDKWNNMCSKSLTEYDRNDIIKKGLNIWVKNICRHKVNNNDITCSYINN
eukprot:305472_1